MKKSIAFSAAAIVLLAACITINIYFPEADAERAADRIIDEVRGTSSASEQDTTSWYRLPAANSVALAVMNLVIPAAHAQGNLDFDASSPAKRALELSLKERFQSLKPYFDSGAIGLGADATIEIRDRASVALNERNQVRQLVAEQNADWEALYAEIARINGHPEWVKDIRRVFAERWIAKAGRGWYYLDSSGNWLQK